jgi:hypothetical protein
MLPAQTDPPRPRHLLPVRFELPLFACPLSGPMSLRVSGVATRKLVGPGDAFVPMWLSAWLTSWITDFPAVMLVAPLARRIVARLTHRQH